MESKSPNMMGRQLDICGTAQVDFVVVIGDHIQLRRNAVHRKFMLLPYIKIEVTIMNDFTKDNVFPNSWMFAILSK